MRAPLGKSHCPVIIIAARVLWDTGIPASKIAERMDMTKNQVIGISYRHRFSSRVPTVIENLIGPYPVEFPPLACLWPFGDPADRSSFHFCGVKLVPGKPYCAEHVKVAYRPLKRVDDELAEAAD